MVTFFGLTPVLVSLAFGGGGALLALIVRLIKGDGAAALLRALETLITGTLGAFLAHSFIFAMFKLMGHTHAATTVISLLFFLWPGLINAISMLAVHHPVITETGVLWLAAIVGGLVGVLDGLWAIHKWWPPLGLLSFPLDVTWGLGGSTNGLLMHLINFAWADHGDGSGETRASAHRYKSGMRLRFVFAFTQGAVMSNMALGGTHDCAPGSDLHNHESIHVWQNRVLGPFFWFSYAGWMLLLLLPALVAGLISKGTRVGAALNWWCYFDNPYEVMAYGIANPTGRTSQDGGSDGWLCWAMPLAIPLGIVGVLILGGGFVAIVHAGF